MPKYLYIHLYLVYSNLNSILNVLTKINNDEILIFGHLQLLILVVEFRDFLTILAFESHFLLNLFLIKKRVKKCVTVQPSLKVYTSPRI